MESDFVISLGISLRNDNPNARYAFNNVQKLNKGAGFYFHPVGDNLVPTFGKYWMFTHKGWRRGALDYFYYLSYLRIRDSFQKRLKSRLIERSY